MADTTLLQIPADLKPADGRFGAGPSKVRPEQLARARRAGRPDGDLAPPEARQGRSSRRVQERPRCSSSRAPDGYEVALGNGGTTCFWDAAAFGLVRERALHLTYGEFSSKFAKVTEARAVPGRPGRHRRRAGHRAGAADRRRRRRRRRLGAQRDLDRRDGARLAAGRGRRAGADRRDVGRRRPARRRRRRRRLLLRPAEVLRRRRRAVAGGAVARRGRAHRRARRVATAGSREFLSLHDRARQLAQAPDLQHARRSRRCCCSPSSSTGCSTAAASRTSASAAPRESSSDHLYGWAEASDVRDPVRRRRRRSARWSSARSTSTTSVDAAAVAATLRANGIVDTEPYRKLGRNQLRVAMFPAIDPDDVRALTACIDYVVENS